MTCRHMYICVNNFCCFVHYMVGATARDRWPDVVMDKESFMSIEIKLGLELQWRRNVSTFLYTWMGYIFSATTTVIIFESNWHLCEPISAINHSTCILCCSTTIGVKTFEFQSLWNSPIFNTTMFVVALLWRSNRWMSAFWIKIKVGFNVKNIVIKKCTDIFSI